MKKLTSLFLAMVMVLCLVPVTLAATGDGTVSDVPDGWNVLNVDSFKNGTYSVYSDQNVTLWLYKDVMEPFNGKPMTIVQPKYSDMETEAFKGSGEYASFKINKSADIYLAFGFPMFGDSNGDWDTKGIACAVIQAPQWVTDAGWESFYIEEDKDIAPEFGSHNGVLLNGTADGVGWTGRIARPYKRTVAVPDGEEVTISLNGMEGAENVAVPYVIFIDWKENSEVSLEQNITVGHIEYEEDASADTVTLKAWIENNSDDFMADAKFVVAKYNSDKSLASAEFKSASLCVGGSNVYTIGTFAKSEVDNVKVFLWDENTMAPLDSPLVNSYDGEMLEDITIDGVSLGMFGDKSKVFEESVTSYTFDVEDGSTVPVVKGIAKDKNVYVTTIYGDISADKKSVTHVVKAELNGKTAEYTLTFKVEDPPLVVAPNGSDWSFENGKSTIALATPGVTKNGEATVDGYLYEAFNNSAPVPENVKINLGTGVISQAVAGLPFFLTDNTDDGTAKNHFGYSADYSGENWITFKLGKPATVYVLSQLNSGADGDIFNKGIVEAGWIWVANDYYTMPMMGSGQYLAYFSKTFGENETYPLEVSIPVSRDESKTGIGFADYVVALKEISTDTVGLKPLISDVTNHVAGMDHEAYYRYIKDIPASEAVTLPTMTGNEGGYSALESSTFTTFGDIVPTSFSKYALIRQAEGKYPIYLSEANKLMGLEGSYSFALPHCYDQYVGVAEWVARAMMNFNTSVNGVSGHPYKNTTKPLWSFKVNAPCEVFVLANPYCTIDNYDLAENGWVKQNVSELPATITYNGTTDKIPYNMYDTNKDTVMYSKKFDAGETVNLYPVSCVGNYAKDFQQPLYIPVVKF